MPFTAQHLQCNPLKAVIEQFQRYGQMIEQMLGLAPMEFHGEAEGNAAVQVERGLVYARSLLESGSTASFVEQLIINSSRLSRVTIVDATGHHRPVYRALLAYCWLKAFELDYERLPRAEFGRWEEALRAWCDQLESDLGEIEWPAGVFPAKRGSSATEAAWAALCLHVAGRIFVRDAWTDLAADTFGRFAKRQLPTGAVLQFDPSDNLETWGYHELVTLHAAASYAVQAEDRTIAKLVAAATQFHAESTQPDHSTAQPWALFAFMWNNQTRTFADAMLHTVSIDPSGVSLMLLADALYCLRLFQPRHP